MSAAIETNALPAALPGEGDTQLVMRTRVRRECGECGKPAQYKHTFLLDGARRNPASRAYGRDDCSWCEDAARFVCEEHKGLRDAPYGYGWCATFTLDPHYAHLFLYWRERNVEDKS